MATEGSSGSPPGAEDLERYLDAIPENVRREFAEGDLFFYGETLCGELQQLITNY